MKQIWARFSRKISMLSGRISEDLHSIYKSLINDQTVTVQLTLYFFTWIIINIWKQVHGQIQISQRFLRACTAFQNSCRPSLLYVQVHTCILCLLMCPSLMKSAWRLTTQQVTLLIATKQQLCTIQKFLRDKILMFSQMFVNPQKFLSLNC